MKTSKKWRKPLFRQPGIELEKYYGVKLFERVSRKLFLTDAGQVVYTYAAKIFSLLDGLNQELKHPVQTTLHIGASMTVGRKFLSPLINQFCAQSAETKFHVVINSSRIIEEEIIANKLDLGIIEGPVSSDYIMCQCLWEDQLSLIVPPRHPLTLKESVDLKEFDNASFVVRESNSGTRQIMDKIFKSAGVKYIPIWESTSTEALISAVQNGIGFSVLPTELVMESLQAGKIACINLKNIAFKRQYNLIYRA